MLVARQDGNLTDVEASHLCSIREARLEVDDEALCAEACQLVFLQAVKMAELPGFEHLNTERQRNLLGWRQAS